MKLTSQGRRASALPVPDDGLEELRTTFFERLKDERRRLLDLAAVLTQGEQGRVPALDELRSRAHRLSGTASVLDLRGVAALARALELAVDGIAAADRLLVPRAENSDRVMCATLQALIQVIDSVGKPSREPRLHERIATPRRPRGVLTG
jgi:chemotaxis protein histidine kinase CheA